MASRARIPKSKRQYVGNFPALLLARTIAGVKPASFPDYIEPALATLRTNAPRGDRWVHEIKYDGYRLQLQLREGAARLFTRRGYDWSKRFAPIAEAAWHLKTHAAVLDGEVIVPAANGQSDFGALQDDLAAGRMGRLVYCAFDLLYLDGLDLRGAALIDRKAVLAELLSDASEPIRFSEHLEADGEAVYRNACKLELEGIVSKRRDARYQSGRTDDWRKVTCRYRETFAVAGMALRRGKFDGLYLARQQDGKLVYAGKVEKGFTAESERSMRERLAPFFVEKQPIAADRKFPKAQWVKPAVLVDVEYRGITDEEKLLRHPSFKGVREDLMDAPTLRREPIRPSRSARCPSSEAR